jgi:predicted transcriptional regulator
MPNPSFKFDPSKDGLSKTLKEYEEIALRYVWSLGKEGAGSGAVWGHVNERLGEKSISRASIIFFLNRMVDQEVLEYREETGKGGHHRIYFPGLDEEGYKKYVVKRLVESTLRDWPKLTKEALMELDL